MNKSFILAIDQETSGTKTVIFDEEGNIVSKATRGLNSSLPQVRFVEQDPQEIYQSVFNSV